MTASGLDDRPQVFAAGERFPATARGFIPLTLLAERARQAVTEEGIWLIAEEMEKALLG